MPMLVVARSVFASARGEALGKCLEQRVSGRMPERVVDFLETVEIEVEERDQLLVSARASECLLEPVAEEIAVGQAGKAVVLRRAFQLRPALGELGFRALALGHVRVRADQAHGAAVAMVTRDDLPVTLDPDPSTVVLP